MEHMPKIFHKLLSENLIGRSDILHTKDGFSLVFKSVADILAERCILDFPDSDGVRLECSKFYDDWFLYAVPDERDFTYSLLKLREQEHDAEDGTPADGDTPGVTISFISFDCEVLFACLANASDENRMRLDGEINRVVCRRGQSHHKALKKYFINPCMEGAYLAASAYIRFIASLAENGSLDVPEHYKEIAQQSISYKNSSKNARLPGFVEKLNRSAGRTVCDNEKIYINKPQEPDEYEAAAILATHTGNTSVHSFAAEVEYHARFLTPLAKIRIPFFGRSIYASAIRADMTIDDTEFEGPAPFYQADSKIVKRQYGLHMDSCPGLKLLQ
ncbi:MAG: hypothetical protein J6P94_04685 [Oscillospiraceae bacterium]|nr:hypothetical protein [Oscillospiraceae bacterium]